MMPITAAISRPRFAGGAASGSFPPAYYYPTAALGANSGFTFDIDGTLTPTQWPTSSVHFSFQGYSGSDDTYPAATITSRNNADGNQGFGSITDPQGLGLSGCVLQRTISTDGTSHGSSPRNEFAFSDARGKLIHGDDHVIGLHYWMPATGNDSVADLIFGDALAFFNIHDDGYLSGLGPYLAQGFGYDITHAIKIRTMLVNAPAWTASGAIGTGTVAGVVVGSPTTATLTITVSSGTVTTNHWVSGTTVSDRVNGLYWQIVSQVTGTTGGSGTYNVSSSNGTPPTFTAQPLVVGRFSNNSTSYWTGGTPITASDGSSQIKDPGFPGNMGGWRTMVMIVKWGSVNGAASPITKIYEGPRGSALTAIVDNTNPNCLDPTLGGFALTEPLGYIKGPAWYFYNFAGGGKYKTAFRRYRGIKNQLSAMLSAGHTYATIASAFQSFVEG